MQSAAEWQLLLLSTYRVWPNQGYVQHILMQRVSHEEGLRPDRSDSASKIFDNSIIFRHPSFLATSVSSVDFNIRHQRIMADAFSLAVNILTVLEFGRKFATLAWDIYKNGKDGIPKIASLGLTSKDLEENGRRLEQLGSSRPANSQNQTDERIRQLAQRCTKVAVQMQETIRGLSVHVSNRKARNAMVNAFRYKWRQNDITVFEMEIQELRNELMLNLNIWLRFVLRYF